VRAPALDVVEDVEDRLAGWYFAEEPKCRSAA
jgi:hypothetical protein